jgi:hypothetical protein
MRLSRRPGSSPMWRAESGKRGGGRNDADQHLTHPGEVVFRNARNIVLEGYRVEAARLALSLGPHDGLAQVQEP